MNIPTIVYKELQGNFLSSYHFYVGRVGTMKTLSNFNTLRNVLVIL